MSKLKSKVALAVLVGAASLFAASVFAIDGQILINQSTVMAAGGFPYKITQPGSYKLSGNLVVPANTDGIDITADNVTVDLNGFSISGPGKCTYTSSTPPSISCVGDDEGFGIFSFNVNTAVKNGSVTGMGSFGVYVSRGGRIEDVSVSQNVAGIGGNVGVFRRCTAAMNRSGIVADSAVVENNAINENETGLRVTGSAVNGNVLNFNSEYGIVGQDSTYGQNTFLGNSLQNVRNDGGLTSQGNNNCDGSAC